MQFWISSIRILAFILMSTAAIGQTFVVKGRVVDNKQNGLPFATVIHSDNPGTGTTTDIDGYYEISSTTTTSAIRAEFLGYKPQEKAFDAALQEQTINFVLENNDVVLEGVEITATKTKYTRKNNPAVELIKKVIANKDANRVQGQDYYQCDQYEKIEFALNNFTGEVFDKKFLKGFKFLQNHIDTSEINGKPFLPFYLKERNSDIYYRKSPQSKKEYIQHEQETKLDQWLINENLEGILEHLYQDIDIYDNNINVFALSIVSPVSSVVGNAFYHYHIMDTIQYNGHEVIDLAFLPANRNDLGFSGSIYILNDGSYAISKATLTIDEKANINWVSDLRLIQEFEKYEDKWIISRDELTGDFGLKKGSQGIFGTRSVHYNNYIFDNPVDPQVYEGSVNVIDLTKDNKKLDRAAWSAMRPIEFSQKQEEIYSMVDTLKETRLFKRIANITTLLLTGYWDYGKVELGPVAAFYSFNDVEGFRPKLGGGTTPALFPKWKIAGYGAYGTKDKTFKYAGELEYSFNDDFKKNPKTFIRATYSHDMHILGQDLELVNENNFLLSFRRGDASKFLFTDFAKIEFNKEYESDFRYNISLSQSKERPVGSLTFNYTDDDGIVQNKEAVNLTQVEAFLRWAPNEQFIQLHDARKPIFGKNPILEFTYTKGFEGVLGGEYNYHKLTSSIFKRLQFSPVGTTDIILEGGKIWGEGLPYYALLAPLGNQTFFYKHRTFNMMNFLEFTSDTYVILNYRHYFKGFIMNRIPLIKRLGLRSMVTFKGVWGTLSDANNPDKNPELIQFTKHADGRSETYTFGDNPYMEASFGISNIFKILRLDIVRRFNYLNHPNVPDLFGKKGLALRAKIQIEF